MKCGRPNCPRSLHRASLCHAHYGQSLKSRPRGFVPTGPVRSHILALINSGMSQDDIAAAASVSRISTIHRVLAVPGDHRMRASSASRIMAVQPLASADQKFRASGYVDATGTIRRVQSLMAIGYQLCDIAQRSDISWQAASGILNGKQGSVIASTAQSVDRVFRELQMAPGGDVRAIRRAKRNGWHPPFAWDEDTIDNPAADPHVSTVDKNSWLDEYRELKGFGLDLDQIAGRMGIRRDSLATKIWRLSK